MVCGVEATHAYRGQTLIWFIVGWRVRARGSRGAGCIAGITSISRRCRVIVPTSLAPHLLAVLQTMHYNFLRFYQDQKYVGAASKYLGSDILLI